MCYHYKWLQWKRAEDFVLGVDVDTADVSAAGTESDQASEPHEGMSTCLTLFIKELETCNKELDVQAMPLHIRALDLLCFCQFWYKQHWLPHFKSEVDSYLNAFEGIAAALSWPKKSGPFYFSVNLWERPKISLGLHLWRICANPKRAQMDLQKKLAQEKDQVQAMLVEQESVQCSGWQQMTSSPILGLGKWAAESIFFFSRLCIWL